MAPAGRGRVRGGDAELRPVGLPQQQLQRVQEHPLPVVRPRDARAVTDLHERGLDKDVTVVAWGEFGRTPQINKEAGRDHWPQVGGGLLAGGGS